MIEYPPIVPVLWFRTLEDALAPLSAGTETKICVVSNCDSTMTTLLDVPHPTWTTEYGKAIVELNMVALGGMNGLNS
jgi:hypothetical protein